MELSQNFDGVTPPALPPGWAATNAQGPPPPPGCSTWANGCGVFTSISGTAPNRIFNIEWRVVRRENDIQTGNFEVLYENDPNKRFDMIYGVSQGVGTYDAAGVQGPFEFFTQDFCNVAGATEHASHLPAGALHNSNGNADTNSDPNCYT
jgi:hypothetical protein